MKIHTLVLIRFNLLCHFFPICTDPLYPTWQWLASFLLLKRLEEGRLAFPHSRDAAIARKCFKILLVASVELFLAHGRGKAYFFCPVCYLLQVSIKQHGAIFRPPSRLVPSKASNGYSWASEQIITFVHFYFNSECCQKYDRFNSNAVKPLIRNWIN